MKTNDRPLTDLMNAVDNGAAQLPDFQRGWVWDDGRIKALILSVIHNFPVGAAMFLEYGNDSIHFKHKPIEGSAANPSIEPDELILDGQQRLTSLYNALFSKNPVHTKTEKGKEIDRYYYINIEKALDPTADDEDVIVSIPATKQIVSDFGRKIEKDLSTKQDEFREKLFPLNIILDPGAEQGGQNDYYAYYNYDPAVIQQFTAFFSKIIMPTQKYAMPVILLDKETPKEAVCQVFENVNTGGVSLTVFELVTAIFAMDNFPLREKWEERREQYFSGDLLNVITSTDFLTALTLLSSFKAGGIWQRFRRSKTIIWSNAEINCVSLMLNRVIIAKRKMEPAMIHLICDPVSILAVTYYLYGRLSFLSYYAYQYTTPVDGSPAKSGIFPKLFWLNKP